MMLLPLLLGPEVNTRKCKKEKENLTDFQQLNKY